MSLAKILESIIGGKHLNRAEAARLMAMLMSGEMTDGQMGGLLVALRVNGCDAEELAGFADAMRASAKQLPHNTPDLIDVVGTGGGRTTFNLSTAAAIVAAAAGAKVAKHGGRAASGRCGAADVLEAVGVKLSGDRDVLTRVLDQTGIVFLFAPHHHEAMKHAAPTRKALGIRTPLNQLGPLTNPAGALRQLTGVFAKDLLLPMAEALALLGTEHAYLVYSDDDLDEISACEGTHYVEVKQGRMEEGRWTPESFGLTPLPEEALAPGEDIAENGKILLEALSDASSVRASAIVPNAAVSLMLAGLADCTTTGAAVARETIASGKARAKLDELIAATNL